MPKMNHQSKDVEEKPLRPNSFIGLTFNKGPNSCRKVILIVLLLKNKDMLLLQKFPVSWKTFQWKLTNSCLANSALGGIHVLQTSTNSC